jgi:hypothetical protein
MQMSRGVTAWLCWALRQGVLGGFIVGVGLLPMLTWRSYCQASVGFSLVLLPVSLAYAAHQWRLMKPLGTRWRVVWLLLDGLPLLTGLMVIWLSL